MKTRTRKKKPSPKTNSKFADLRVIFVTAPVDQAEKIARQLVEERLAACANLLPEITSLYWWDGKLNRDAETLIVLKTPVKQVEKLLRRLKQIHTYTVPEFIAMPVIEHNPDYVKWAVMETR